MKNLRNKTKGSAKISYVLMMLLCTAMIGASCWFAYTQTAKDINMELNSVMDQTSRIQAAAPETGVIRESPTFPPASEATLPLTTEQPETESIQETDPAPTPATEMPPTAPPVVVGFRIPCDGEILQPFSAGELVRSSTTGVWQTHNGTDIAAELGDPVYPVEAGIVTDVEEDALWGICVTVDHENGITSKYCGLHPGLKVTSGDRVTIEEPLGLVGETAEIEGKMPPHLHFEVKQAEAFIDPMTYIYQHP